MTHLPTMTRYSDACRFFRKHAGYATPPGKAECARKLARAEEHADRNDWRVEWEQDDITNFSHDARDPGDPEYYLWSAVLLDSHGAMLASLGGIDFGHSDGCPREPWGEPYARVVAAELADEAIRTLAAGIA